MEKTRNIIIAKTVAKKEKGSKREVKSEKHEANSTLQIKLLIFIIFPFIIAKMQ